MIGPLLKAYLDKYDIPVRVIAKTIGVSPATISRITRGESCDQETMVKLLCWLFRKKDRP